MKNLLQKIAASFKTRSFRVGGYSVAAIAIVLAIAVMANVFINALPATVTQFDTTSNQLFSISQQTTELLDGLTQDITIYWVVQEGAEDSAISTLLDRYKALSSKISIEKIDPDVYPTFAQQYYSGTIYNNSLVVTCGDTYRYVSCEEIYLYEYSDYYYYTGEYFVSFDGESALTSAIDFVISEDIPTVYTLTGHGESSIPSSFSTAVDKENILTEELSLLTAEEVPEDADCILILSPQSDISSEEKTVLESYLAAGGSIVLISDPSDGEAFTNLYGLMGNYGLSAVEGIVVESNQNNYAWGTPYCLLPDYGSHSIVSPLSDGGYYVMLPIAHGITVTETDNADITVTELLTTSENAFSKLDGYSMQTYEKEDGDLEGPFALAVAASDNSSGSNLIWVSSSSLLSEQYNTQVSGGNQDLFLNMLGYICEPEGSSITIHAKSLSMEYLTMDTGTVGTLSFLLIGLIPLGYLAVGIVIWFRRKRK